MRVIQILIVLAALIYSKEIRVASYNVENLFDLKKSGKEYDLYTPSLYGWDLESYRTKMDNISTVIAALNADIIALQEIENTTILKELMKKSNRKGTQYSSFFFGEDDKSRGSVGVAVLSKYPLSHLVTHPVYTGKRGRSRNVLECRSNTPLGELRIIVVHWPSKRNDEAHRIQAAKVTASIIDTLPVTCRYLILGDFNSNHDEAVRLLSEKSDNTNGTTGINHLLKTTDSPIGSPFRLLTAKEVINKGKGYHFNPWQELKGFYQYSYRYRGDLTTLDHILIPSSLLTGQGMSYLPNSFSHFTMNSVLTQNLTPYRWQISGSKEEKRHENRGYSDHLPVILILTNQPVSYKSETDSTYGSFEQSNDGWIIRSPHFTAVRTTAQACEGSYSLHIRGKGKRNGVMASCSAIIPPKTKQATLSIAGSGEYAIRIKNVETNKWYYLVGSHLSESGSKSYTKSPYRKWVQRKIPLYPFNAGDTVNIELRYRGDVHQNIYLDESSLNGWFRVQER